MLEAFGSIKELASADVEAIAAVDGLGEVIAKSIQRYFAKEEAQVLMKELEPMALICPILDKRWQMMPSYLVRQLF
ncbi:MAG: helix-hairpin-helix domain-containing protein [Streptococcus salivarius]